MRSSRAALVRGGLDLVVPEQRDFFAEKLRACAQGEHVGVRARAFHASMSPSRCKAVRRIAEYLTGGTCRLEVRGHSDGEPMPEGGLQPDSMDLSYSRARAVTGVSCSSSTVQIRGSPGSP